MKTFIKPIIIFIMCSFLLLDCFAQNNNQTDGKYLIVLDAQEYYTIGKLSESSAQRLMDSINYVISNFNADNVLCIKSVHRLLNLSLSCPLIYVSVDSSAMRFDKRMNNVNEQVFIKEKSSASAFIIEELNDFLKQHNANEIVIIGLMAEGSLYKSLIEGKDLGYDMYTIPEAIIGKTQKSKDKAVKKLAKEGVKILAINTIINQKTGSVF